MDSRSQQELDRALGTTRVDVVVSINGVPLFSASSVVKVEEARRALCGHLFSLASDLEK